MSDIKERLDKVRALIQEPEFLEGKIVKHDGYDGSEEHN